MKIKRKKSGFVESLSKIKKDWNQLTKNICSAKDPRFLLRMAINIKQIHYDVKRAQHPKCLESQARALAHFFSTPVGAPFVTELTLLQAADTFSYQEPAHSDLSELLSQFSAQGMQLLASNDS